MTGLFGKNAHAPRYACAEPKNAGRLLSCRNACGTPSGRQCGRTLQALAHHDVLKLIDEISKLAFAVEKQDALDRSPQEEFGSYPEILLEFRTGPDRNVRNTRFGCRRANLAEASAAREPG